MYVCMYVYIYIYIYTHMRFIIGTPEDGALRELHRRRLQRARAALPAMPVMMLWYMFKKHTPNLPTYITPTKIA